MRHAIRDDQRRTRAAVRTAAHRPQADRLSRLTVSTRLSDHRNPFDFSGARFRNIYFTGATVRGAWLEDVDIDGEIRNVRINRVDSGQLVEAELNRRYPERTKLEPVDADGFHEAWAIIEQAWPPTVDQAKRLPQDLLPERVEGEWSFIETLRHLVLATDAWVRRAILGLAEPYSPLGLPHEDGARPERDERPRRTPIAGRDARTTRQPHAHRSRRHRWAHRRRARRRD